MSSAAYQTLNDRRLSSESGPLPPSPPSLMERDPSLTRRVPSLSENSPQSVGTIHGRLYAHELNDPVSQSEIQTSNPQPRVSLQPAGTVHGRPSAHGLSSQAMHNIGPTLLPQEGNNSYDRHNAHAIQGDIPPENITQVEENHNTVHNVDPVLNRRTRRKNSRKAVKAAIKMASLNMRGYGNSNQNHIQNKWNHVNQIMREEKIGILLLQETHMNTERYNQVHKLFEKRLHILYSADPESPTRKGGVAIVLNKRFVPTQGPGTIKTDEIVSGRALLLTLKLSERRKLKILVIYAPNDPGKNRDFWTELNNFFEQFPNKKPDLMAGDFNMVEDPLDRLPSHSDQEDTTEALDNLKQLLGLEDGWRNTFPQRKSFTYLQSNGCGSQSRIDRIYSRPHITATAREWKMTTTGMPHADHRMVSVQIVDENAPQTSSGRWSFPAHLTKDGPLLKYIEERGREAQLEINENESHNYRNEYSNPQTIYSKFKKDVLDMARKRKRAIIPKLIQEIRKCEYDLETINNDTDVTPEEKIVESEILTQKLSRLKRKQHLKVRSSIAVKNRIEGETMTRSWTQNNKAESPRDIIYALRKPEENNNGDPYEKDSQRMAELARNYHESLQKDGINPDKELRERCTEEALASLQKRLTPEQSEQLRKIITEEDVEEALQMSENFRSPGMDGSTYELWKYLHQEYKKKSLDENTNTDTENEKKQESFSIVKILTACFNDIQKYGVSESTDFSIGWMCPIYKKNDRNEISNYRPITILNSDYKILTKVLALRLAKVAPSLLHKSQAGFVPGRSIAEQTKLIEVMIDYAEASEQNGLIVALDQEKAYDKIAHDYLWKVLATFGFPEDFIALVKTLYQNAETTIMINGHLSSTYKITRGVRQGDPMSCLLFDLAIEPLAALLRASHLKGYNIPGQEEKLIANLFADDTTTFLSEDDNMEDLQIILTKWCNASTAKFNIQKTEVIPIGTQEHRAKVIETRRVKDSYEEIPNNIHIARDGEPVRILGSWVGNKIDNENIWSVQLDKIDHSLKRWEKCNPTIEGRKLIVQIVVGGMTQYLTQVQGMPAATEKKLERKIKKYIWGDKTISPVNIETLYAPINIGGRGLLDIKSRNEAIDLMWLKSYLNFSEDRPLWTLVADAYMAVNLPQSEPSSNRGIKQSVFLQSWKTLTGPRSSKTIKKLFQTAKKFAVRLEGLAFTPSITTEMPIWHHTKADPKIKSLARSKTSKCLIKNHKIMKVGEAEELANSLQNIDHTPDPNCLCADCIKNGDTKNCEHPHNCYEQAENLIRLLPSKWNPRLRFQLEDETIIDNTNDPNLLQRQYFNAAYEVEGTIADAFRAFTEKETTNTIPQKRTDEENRKTVKVQVAVKQIGVDDPKKLVAVIYYGKENPQNSILKIIPPEPCGQEIGSLIAIKKAVKESSTNTLLHIETNNKKIVKLLSSQMNKEEDLGFLLTQHPDQIQALVAELRNKKQETSFLYKSFVGNSPLEVEITNLLNEGIGLGNETGTEIEVNPETIISGAKLSKLTQATAYRIIRSLKMRKYSKRRQTKMNVERIIQDVKQTLQITLEEKNLWNGIRNNDLNRTTRVFLWMTIHDAYMIGENWLRPGFALEYQERSMCQVCQTTETMDHILTKCKANGQAQVWKLAQKLWFKKDKTDLAINLGTILASPCTMIKGNREKRHGTNRLYRIIMSESAHLIWKVGCERVIQMEGEEVPLCKIENRWIEAINAKLDLDRKLTNPKYKTKSLSTKQVQQTWRHTLRDERLLPENWITDSGVLVGIDLREDDGRGRDRPPTPGPEA